jgi:hypothetical protein
MLQVKNQGVNAKTQENKMLENNNTRILDDRLTLFLQNREKEVQKEPISSGQLKVDNDGSKEKCEEDGWLASKSDLKKIPIRCRRVL